MAVSEVVPLKGFIHLLSSMTSSPQIGMNNADVRTDAFVSGDNPSFRVLRNHDKDHCLAKGALDKTLLG